jgi:iron complex transport system substrate-binding protein
MRYYSILFLLIAFGCQNPSANNNNQKAERIVRPEFAKGFEIHYSNGGFNLILFDLKTNKDTLENIRFDSICTGNLACLSTTHISYFNLLNSLDRVKAVAFADLIRNPNAKALIEGKAMINLSTAEDVDIELLLASKPQYFFVYPYGHGNYEKYESKGIACIPISEYLEQDPLGRLEWIKVFGAIIGKEHEAFELFENIKLEYLKTKQEIELASALKPCAFTGSYDGGVWYAPPGNSFQAKLISDAGATYIFKDSISVENLAIPFESLYSSVYNCDFWGKVDYTEQGLSLQKIKDEDERWTQISAYKNSNIFYCNSSDVDYFGDAVVQPHILLKDLGLVFHPDLFPSYIPTYFKKLKPV